MYTSLRKIQPHLLFFMKKEDFCPFALSVQKSSFSSPILSDSAKGCPY